MGSFTTAFILITLFGQSYSLCHCPSEVKSPCLSPCLCIEGIGNPYIGELLFCSGNASTDNGVRNVMKQLKERCGSNDYMQIESVRFINSLITSLDEEYLNNVFHVEKLLLKNNIHLTTIDINALNQLKWLEIDSCPAFRDSNIFRTIDRFLPNLEVLTITNTSISTIPNLAYRKEGNKLNMVILSGNQISNIGSEAFSGLWYMENLDLSSNKISKIANTTFKMLGRGRNLRLDLRYNQISSESIENGTLSEFGKTTSYKLEILLQYNKITYLPEGIFKPFIMNHKENYVDVHHNLITCDCKSKWLLELPNERQTQFGGIICQDTGKAIWDYNVKELNC